MINTLHKVDRALRARCYSSAALRRIFSASRSEITIHLLVAVSLSILSSTSLAQNVERIAEREVARRQAKLPEGRAALERGRAAMEAKNYPLAHEEFRTAVNFLPDAVTSGKAHDEALTGFCESGVRLAEERVAEGKYAEAEQIAREIVSDRYNPNCDDAKELLANLQTPGRLNKTMGPKFVAKVEEVKKLLSDADDGDSVGRKHVVKNDGRSIR